MTNLSGFHLLPFSKSAADSEVLGNRETQSVIGRVAFCENGVVLPHKVLKKRLKGQRRRLAGLILPEGSYGRPEPCPTFWRHRCRGDVLAPPSVHLLSRSDHGCSIPQFWRTGPDAQDTFLPNMVSANGPVLVGSSQAHAHRSGSDCVQAAQKRQL